MQEQSKCRSCGAAIIWAKMLATGKSMPIDALPDAGRGNIVPSPAGAVVLKGDDLERESAAGTDLYVSHFATCPQAAQHRKPK